MKDWKDWKDEIIIDEVVAEFAELAKIPRPSGCEKAAGDYLEGRFRQLGAAVSRDAAGNLRADLPASPGREEHPRVILQGHMDMVCTAEPGRSFNALTDPIRLIRGENTLTADGTSLGSDDGTGIGVILYLFKHRDDFSHGPLRAVITVDEEAGMTGARALAEDWLTDARYLINCDSENADELTIGSAGSINLDFLRQISFEPIRSREGNAFEIKLSGLLGGHSGECIGLGRGNALRSMAFFLTELAAAAIDYRLVSFEGGSARNAIPAEAAAVIVTTSPESELKKIADCAGKKLQKLYPADNGATVTVRSVPLPPAAAGAEDTLALIGLLTNLHTGVYSMSRTVPGLVETSANIGQVIWPEREEGGTARVLFLPRSAMDERLAEFRMSGALLAAATGWKLEAGEISPGWTPRAESPLAQVINRVYREQNGTPMKVGAIHAGLECGFHARKAPTLDIVSIGVTTRNIHSPRETLELNTVPVEVKLIAGTIEVL